MAKIRLTKPTAAIAYILDIDKEKEIIDFLKTKTYKSKEEIKFLLHWSTLLPLYLYKPLTKEEIKYLQNTCECVINQ